MVSKINKRYFYGGGVVAFIFCTLILGFYFNNKLDEANLQIKQLTYTYTHNKIPQAYLQGARDAAEFYGNTTIDGDTQSRILEKLQNAYYYQRWDFYDHKTEYENKQLCNLVKLSYAESRPISISVVYYNDGVWDPPFGPNADPNVVVYK